MFPANLKLKAMFKYNKKAMGKDREVTTLKCSKQKEKEENCI